MSGIKTVKIKNADGFAIINESDFDSKTMTLYKEGGGSKEKATTKKKPTK